VNGARRRIVVNQDDRISWDKHGWRIANVVIRDNDVSDGIVGCDLAGLTCSSNS
jgi:hypothetical protein